MTLLSKVSSEYTQQLQANGMAFDNKDGRGTAAAALRQCATWHAAAFPRSFMTTNPFVQRTSVPLSATASTWLLPIVPFAFNMQGCAVWRGACLFLLLKQGSTITSLRQHVVCH
jgi:hypothetical protein